MTFGKIYSRVFVLYKFDDRQVIVGRISHDEIPRYLTSDNFNLCVKKLKQNPQLIIIDKLIIFDPSKIEGPYTSRILDCGGDDKLVFVGINSDEISATSNSNGEIIFTFTNYPNKQIILMTQNLSSSRWLESFIFEDKTMTFEELRQVFLS